MARNKIKFTSGVAFIALLIGANILLLLPQEQTAKINFFFVKITSPLLNLIPRSNPSKDDTVSKAKYDKLIAEHTFLQSRLREITEDNLNLAHIRQNPPMPGPAIVIARISKVIEEGQRNEIIINKGSADGLKKGQYVLSAGHDRKDNSSTSVIGTISELSNTMSKVQLVTDANHYLMASIWRDGIKLDIEGQIKGNNKMQAKMPLMTRKEFDIQINDFVFAKVKPGFLDTPLVVGKVSDINPDDQAPMLWDITITPIIDIRSLTDVGVVVIDMKTSSTDEDK
ncbi:MAG: hypothetical protein K9M75_12735 [Phycisphaerae bacterium]|nr:hypothetical protein [Phycisphaerae bacterium]